VRIIFEYRSVLYEAIWGTDIAHRLAKVRGLRHSDLVLLGDLRG